jgi:DnaA regulatory inactivator Hda
MSNAALQIPLDLGHCTAMGREDFLIAPSNQDAAAWIDLWPDWPAPALILYGPPACGKTHLCAVWRDKTGAEFLDASTLKDSSVRQDCAAKHIILDDADSVIGDTEREKGLFHLYNVFKEEGRSVLITLREPPVRRNFAVPDLASRLRAAPAVAIREPDDALLGAVLVKMFSDRQLKVGEDVVRYILAHMERSFEAARKVVESLDGLALSQQRAITVPLVRGVV